MSKTEICQMCDNYSVRNKCDQKKDCKIMKIMDENAALKKQVKELKKELAEAKLNMSYMIDPNAIGDRNDMGCGVALLMLASLYIGSMCS